MCHVLPGGRLVGSVGTGRDATAVIWDLLRAGDADTPFPVRPVSKHTRNESAPDPPRRAQRPGRTFESDADG
ncbi:hypothetical protein Axi01nite_11640 [Actinoplanes xinjiangensis]|nr:hypothetical protein Axi01nite_11640 [Actinoplanes xinjiangensis]